MTSGQDKSSRSTTRSSAGGNGRKKPRPRRPTITPPRRSFRGDLIERFAEGWFTWGLLLAVGFLLVSSSLAVWTRAQPLIAVERVMTETRLVRVEFQSVNEEQTRARRENARQATPRVYDANEDRVRSLATAVRTLPRRAAEAGTLDQVPSEVRRRFGLNAARFEALSRIGADPEALESWDESVSELLTVLRRTPLLTAQAYRAASIEGRDRRLELVRDGESELVPRAQAVNIEDAGQLESTLQRVVEIAGFQGPPAQTVLSGLTSDPQPTYSLDESLTAERQRAAAEQVLPVVDTRSVGQVIFSRGDVLTPSQFETYAAELREFRAWAASNAPWRLWMPRIAVGGAISGLIALLVLTLLTIDPGLIRQTRRLAGAAALVLGAQIIAALIAVLEQRFAYVGALLPVLLAASVLTIVHGRALAIPMGIAAAVVVGLTIELSAGLLLVMVLAVVGAAFGLGDIRDRRVVVRTGVACGVLVAITTPTIGMIGRPATPDALAQAMGDATLAGLAALIAQAITLFALPNVERLFGVTTGLALIELRDPKQRLLRDLQQRAPGTYNHSLNVASIAESAANAIGADALLTYVGALFHDIGKMMFAFVVFWAHIGFSQYMLIWYAAIPEETVWYMRHGAGFGDGVVAGSPFPVLLLVLLLGHFVIPFVGLLSREVKRRPARLARWAVWLLVMHWLDMIWLVRPELRLADGVTTLAVNWVDMLALIAGLLALGGVFLAALAKVGSNVSLVAQNDPRLVEAMVFENF